MIQVANDKYFDNRPMLFHIIALQKKLNLLQSVLSYHMEMLRKLMLNKNSKIIYCLNFPRRLQIKYQYI